MPESPCIVARRVGPDTPPPSGYLTFFNETSANTSSIAAGHDVLGIPGYLVDPKTEARRQQIPSVAVLCDESAGNILRTPPIMHRNRRELPPTLLLNTPFTSTIPCTLSYLSEPSGSPIYFWKCNCNRDQRLTVGGFSRPGGAV